MIERARRAPGPAVAALATVVFLIITRPTLGVVIDGAVKGALISLVAMGIVLVYRATRVLNLAQAELGAIPAVTGLLLVTHGVPYFVAVPIIVVLAIVLGLIVDQLLRRFRDAPRLIVTVATLGIAQVLAAGEVLLPKYLIGSGLPPSEVHTPFTRFGEQVGGIRLSGDDLVAVVVVLVLGAGLAAFLSRSLLGTALRAAVDNRDRAATLGIPVDRLTAVVWVLASVLSAVAVLLRSPLIGFPSGGGTSTTLLLFALAAAVIGRLESLPVTFAAGVGIGVIDASTYFHTGLPGPSVALILPLVLVSLLLRRGSTSRAREESFRSVKELAPIPAVLQRLPEVRIARIVLAAAGIGLLIALPPIVGPDKVEKLPQLPILAMAGLSVVVLTGWAGQISLGQWAFAGIGALSAGRLAADAGWDAIVTLFIAAVVGAVIAVLVGIPALRVDGTALAVVTLAVGGAVASYLLDGSQVGFLQPKHDVNRPLVYQRFDTNNADTFYWCCLAVLGLALVMVYGFRRSRTGRLLLATRDNPRAASAYGVSVAGVRLAGFAVAGALAAVGGALQLYQAPVLNGQTYSVQESITVFAITVIGGVSSPAGAIAGAGYYVTFNYLVSPAYSLLATGAGLLLLLLIFPGGLAEIGVLLRDKALAVVARRRGLVVDSFGVPAAEPELVLAEVPA